MDRQKTLALCIFGIYRNVTHSKLFKKKRIQRNLRILKTNLFFFYKGSQWCLISCVFAGTKKSYRLGTLFLEIILLGELLL